MKKEKTVKTHQRRTKSGKVVVVKEHKAKYDAAEELKKALAKAAGAGGELSSLKKKKAVEVPDYSDYGLDRDDFLAWFEGDGSEGDKRAEKYLRKVLGRKAYTELNDLAADNYKRGGADKFFDRYVVTEHGDKIKATVLGDKAGTPKPKGSKKPPTPLSQSEIDSLDTPIKHVRKVADALGISEREAASWIEGADFKGYKEVYMRNGNDAARKFLGAKVFDKLDPNEADAPLAVMAKIGIKGLGGSKFLEMKKLAKSSSAKKEEASVSETPVKSVAAPAPKPLPAVKGLFKKGSDYAKGWANVDKAFLRFNIGGKLEKAGYTYVDSKVYNDPSEMMSSSIAKYSHPQYGTAYVYATRGTSDYDGKGRWAYGNVDIIRGSYGDRSWDEFNKYRK